MRHDDDVAVLRTHVSYILRGEAFVHHAGAFPVNDFHIRLGGGVLGEEFIGRHDDCIVSLCAQGIDNFKSVSRRTADIGLGSDHERDRDRH